ncbi:MAG: tyrosine-type recombinase/integrase, partial [Acidimicrobiales bacterium]
MLSQLFRHSGRRHPDELTEADLSAWITNAQPANNTIRQRLSTARTFLRWAVRNGHATTNPADSLATDSPLRRVQRTYGKVQDAHPARFLTREQAFGSLVGTCADGDLTDLRDEIALRLGLSGMRRSEILRLRVGDLHLDTPRITWTGKGRKPRQVTPGASLVGALRRWLAAYADG